jgi:hypoxanthine phosphoribosyltransferase
MDSIKVHNRNFKLLIRTEKIQSAVLKLSKKINSDLAGKEVVFLAVLNGSFLFAADLIRLTKLDCRITFIKMASYEGMENTGKLTQLIGLEESLEDKTVVIVEDIVDSGNTLDTIIKELNRMKPASIKIATLLFKPDAYEYKHALDYVGFRIPDRFVVGYGLDYYGYGRNLDGIYSLSDE